MQDLAIEETSGGGGRKIDLILGIAAIVIVAGASAWFLLGSDGSADLDDIAEPVAASVEASAPTELSVTATEGESATALAEKARMALSADMLAEPAGQNALYYYSLAAEANPDDATIRDELNTVAGQVADLIRGHMAAENWTAAEQLASRLALAQPGASVLGEYQRTVDTARQTLLDQAVAEATAGRARSAGALLDQAEALPGSAEASVRQTRQRLAAIAGERRAAAEAQAAAAAEEAAARQAAAQQRAAETAPPAEAASAPAAPVTRSVPATPRVAADEALANTIRGKITSGELTGEAGAIAELGAAANQFPDSAALGATANLLFAAVDAEVQRQLAGDDTAAAGALIQSIEPLPGAADIVPELRATLGDAERRLAGATVISASLLEITETVQPVYPRGALRRELQGWVDIEFTVTSDGSTSDIVVTNSSNNTTIFNRSTLQAVSQWRFKPRMFRGQPIDQRVTTRVGYRLE